MKGTVPTFNAARCLLFSREVTFADILYLEQLYVIHWLIFTPCQRRRERQILSVGNLALGRYLRLLDPQYVSLLLVALKPSACRTVLYRLSLEDIATTLVRLSYVVQERILALFDRFTRLHVRKVMLRLSREFYLNI
ncbi:hypothetical protein [Serratia marcescens]|uniref:hypothetical protein n=1 Tax=Serratia marcescens TaxID=615 RepID=UPI000A397890|nr:hypothetical protein [Serratia marcescens]OUI68975.1 hypothetical protein AZZ99_003266 [Serratia marcescens]HEJ0329756.1 hypothetical protein [Serratia marcescens]